MRIVAFKHPDWTGRVAIVVHKDDKVTTVRIDGVYYHGQVTGRVVGRPQERWYFTGPQSREGMGVPGLPPWVHLLPKNIVVAREPCARQKCDACGCKLARHLGELEIHKPGCSNFPL